MPPASCVQEGAELLPGAAETLRELSACATVCIMAHVASDIGEAVVKGTLEAAGVVGPGQGQVPQHRVLCCSTPAGKESIARQLEPGLHIDAEPSTVRAGTAALLWLSAAALSRMRPGAGERAAALPAAPHAGVRQQQAARICKPGRQAAQRERS